MKLTATPFSAYPRFGTSTVPPEAAAEKASPPANPSANKEPETPPAKKQPGRLRKFWLTSQLSIQLRERYYPSYQKMTALLDQGASLPARYQGTLLAVMGRHRAPLNVALLDRMLAMNPTQKQIEAALWREADEGDRNNSMIPRLLEAYSKTGLPDQAFLNTLLGVSVSHDRVHNLMPLLNAGAVLTDGLATGLLEALPQYEAQPGELWNRALASVCNSRKRQELLDAQAIRLIRLSENEKDSDIRHHITSLLDAGAALNDDYKARLFSQIMAHKTEDHPLVSRMIEQNRDNTAVLNKFMATALKRQHPAAISQLMALGVKTDFVKNIPWFDRPALEVLVDKDDPGHLLEGDVTYLMCASILKSTEVMEKLLEKAPALLDKVNIKGSTALDYASYNNSADTTVPFLLDRGADLGVSKHEGRNILKNLCAKKSPNPALIKRVLDILESQKLINHHHSDALIENWRECSSPQARDFLLETLGRINGLSTVADLGNVRIQLADPQLRIKKH